MGITIRVIHCRLCFGHPDVVAGHSSTVELAKEAGGALKSLTIELHPCRVGPWKATAELPAFPTFRCCRAGAGEQLFCSILGALKVSS